MKPNGREPVTRPDDRKHGAARPNGEAAPGAEPNDFSNDKEEAARSAPDGDSAPTVDELEAELSSARGELGRAMDQFRRLAADFDNYKKRNERERLETTSRAQADVVRRLLDVVDDLELVAAYSEDTPAPLLEGVQLVERKHLQILGSLGLERIEAEGATFDPTTMEGLATVPAESADQDDLVADVFQQGYLFNGQVLRPARVRVKQHEA
jgi:molecular chaperone GrpE